MADGAAPVGAKWFEIWGIDVGDKPPPILLFKLAAAVTTREEAEESAQYLRDTGRTEVSVREVGE